MNPKVDAYLSKAKKWQNEMRKLRTIVLDCGLTEELKWYQPCYTFQQCIVVLISPFKEYCALAFFKGALLGDANGLLVSPGENSQSMRQIRFTNVHQIGELEPILNTYIHEAIEIEKSGLKIQKNPKLTIPAEFKDKFSQPKQSKTRESRVEKCPQQILDGKGLNDR